MHDSLLEIGKFVQSALDNIPIEDEELDAATEQLIKFMGTKEEAIEYAQKELKGQEDGSYWFKYWSGLIDRLNNAKD